MDRRTFLATAAAAATLPTLGTAAVLDYAPGVLEERLAAGDTVMLRFTASWCSTCAAQERAMTALKAENPAYEAITYIDVDWDTYGRSDLTRDMNIPRRSTLVALKGDVELGRIIAGTGKSQIKELMDAALSAATA